VRLASLVSALVITLAFVNARADEQQRDDHERARVAFKSGSRHYNLGEFQQALDAFREAYRAVDDPSFLFNIAQCERQLGHKREAVRSYRAYLNNAPATPNREQVKQLITQLDKEIADEQATVKMPPTTVTPPPPPLGNGLTATPPPPTTAPTATLTTNAPPPAEHKPAYKKWWVWTIVGGVAAAGVATGLALGLTPKSAPTAETSLGTRSPF
jgi:tetratricopeptide (TPR) repeat protein